MTDQPTLAEPECEHEFKDGAVLAFDKEAAAGLDTHEVRQRWPRLLCLKCGAICYASFEHYIYGDY